MLKIKPQKNLGFTLIELLVVISIIGFLASASVLAFNSARIKARDTRRKADMKQLQTALEMYFQDNSSYPLPFPVGGWGGVSTVPCHSANGTTSGPNAYISGLTPKYMAQLPVDPAAPGSCNGYLYYSNGVNYKLLANGTPESYPAAGQPFYDPARPIGAWMLCSANPTACNTW